MAPRKTVVTRYAGKERTKIMQFLDTLGDGSGTKTISADYSSTPGVFKIRPARLSDAIPSEVYRIQALRLVIEDTGIAADKYGGLAALTNGLQLRVMNSAGVKQDLLGGLTIKRHSDWARLGEVRETTTGTANFVFVDIDFEALPGRLRYNPRR